MNYSIILFITIFHLYLSQQYQLKYYFLIIDTYYNLTLYNKNNFKDEFFYSGISESINTDTHFIKEGAHELVFLLSESNIRDIERFPKTTIFIISKDFVNNLENKYQNYKIFIIDMGNNIVSYHFRDSTFCIIGKMLDEAILRVLQIFLYSSLIICLIIFFLNIIMTKIIRIENRLPIHSYINFFCFFLASLIFLNGLVVISLVANNFLFNFGYLCSYSIIKGFYYSAMFFCLRGDIILSFNENVRHCKKISYGNTFLSFFLTIFIKYFTYNYNFITELKLLYIKSILEHFILLCCTIYFIKGKLIPLHNQMKYEQRIHSELVECIKFKFKRMLFLDVLMVIYSLFFILSTPIEHKYIFSYVDNITIHLTLQLFYEAVFFIFFFIIFFPIKLPRYYYDKVIFNYENTVNLLVNISKNKNISILTSNILKKKNNLPIVFVNPFVSSENIFSSNEIYIGFSQK